jgi:hypothetical protein
MPPRRREIELSVERPVGPGSAPGAVARLTARWEPGPDGERPSPAELKRALDEILADLDALVGPPLAAAPIARPDRELGELVETYRPRQRELVDLLQADNEITPGEHALLAAYLGGRASAPTPVPRGTESLADRPIAAVPIIAAERSSPPSRSVAELLRAYEIASLRQAGAVRARRQISFAEYMALKQHFERAEAEGKPAARRTS